MTTWSDFNRYQQLAMESAVYDFKGNGDITYPALGLAGETGEVVEQVKKMRRDDGGVITDERKQKILLEMGDVLWYLAALAKELDTDLDVVANLNLAKLRRRKANGTLQGSGSDR